jgi:hypothetical protein
MRLIAAVLPAQSATPLIQLGEPSRFMKRRPVPLSVCVFHCDVETASASAPWRPTMSDSRVAMSFIASSHDTSRQCPAPRAPSRSSGFRTRFGCAKPDGACTPLMHIHALQPTRLAHLPVEAFKDLLDTIRAEYSRITLLDLQRLRLDRA